MIKSTYGSPMDKNIYGPPMATNSITNWGDKQKIHEIIN